MGVVVAYASEYVFLLCGPMACSLAAVSPSSSSPLGELSSEHLWFSQGRELRVQNSAVLMTVTHPEEGVYQVLRSSLSFIRAIIDLQLPQHISDDTVHIALR